MSNVGRVLTLEVKIENDHDAKWIWENHMGTPSNGIYVMGISDGQVTKDLEKAFQDLEKYQKWEDDDRL